MKQRWMRSVVCMMLAIAMTLSCVGCGGTTSGKADGDKDGKITLTVTVASAELGDSTLFEQYMKEHPNIIIEEVPTSSTDTKLMSMIASGSPPDLIRFTGYDELPVFVQRGILMPLDELLENSENYNEEDMYEIMDICRFDGEERGTGSVYGIPKDWSPIGLWINKDAFADAGIPLPSATEPMTWDEFADTAQKLVKKEGESIKRHGFITSLNMPTLLEMYLSSYGKSMWNETADKSTLLSKDTQDAIKYFQAMQETAAMSNTLYPNPDTIGHSALVKDNVGMVLAGSWFRGTFESGGILSDVEDKLMYVPAPVGTETTSLALDVTCLGIFSQTEHPEEAYDLLEYLTLHEASVTSRSKIGFNLPVSKKYTDTLPNTSEFDKQILATVNKQLETFSPTAAKVCPWISYTSLTTLFDKFYLPVLYKKSSLEQAVKTIDQEIDILVEEGKELMGD